MESRSQFEARPSWLRNARACSPLTVGFLSFRRKRTSSLSEWERRCTYWFGRRVPAALLCPFLAGNETLSRQAGGRAAWAEQGNFRFIRLDGGQIESWKAERTWWGNNLAPKTTSDHIYDRDFEQMLGLLKQADFNWIWVTWSSGWSFKDEEENRKI